MRMTFRTTVSIVTVLLLLILVDPTKGQNLITSFWDFAQSAGVDTLPGPGIIPLDPRGAKSDVPIFPPDSGTGTSETGIFPPDSAAVTSDIGNSPPDSGVFPPETGVFPSDTGVFPPDTGVFPQETGIFPPETGVFPPETGIFPPETGVFPPETGVFPSETGLPQTVQIKPSGVLDSTFTEDVKVKQDVDTGSNTLIKPQMDSTKGHFSKLDKTIGIGNILTGSLTDPFNIGSGTSLNDPAIISNFPVNLPKASVSIGMVDIVPGTSSPMDPVGPIIGPAVLPDFGSSFDVPLSQGPVKPVVISQPTTGFEIPVAKNPDSQILDPSKAQSFLETIAGQPTNGVKAKPPKTQLTNEIPTEWTKLYPEGVKPNRAGMSSISSTSITGPDNTPFSDTERQLAMISNQSFGRHRNLYRKLRKERRERKKALREKLKEQKQQQKQQARIQKVQPNNKRLQKTQRKNKTRQINKRLRNGGMKARKASLTLPMGM